jgi:response regulator NasT
MQPTPTAGNGSPGEAASHPQASADPPVNDRRGGPSLRVIVADDDPALHPFYQQALARLGHQVCLALTGQQLVEQCRLLCPDLVIAGVKLADLDGTAAEEICRDRPTPIILVSGGQDTDALARALANPYILACLFKPVREADLKAAIAVTMPRFEQLESVRKEAAGLQQALEDRKLIERAKGLVMRHAGVDEEEAYRRLQNLACNQNRKLLEVAQALLFAEEVFQPPQRTTAPVRRPAAAGKRGLSQRT